MKIDNKKHSKHCEICILSKSTKYVSRKPDERAISPMSFVHVDVCGPVDPVGRDGFRYALAFVDDYSGAVFVYF